MKKRYILCLILVVVLLNAAPVYAFAIENIPDVFQVMTKCVLAIP